MICYLPFLRQSPSILHLSPYLGRFGMDWVSPMYFVVQIMNVARQREERQKTQKKMMNISFRYSQSTYTSHPPNRVSVNAILDESMRCPGHDTHPWCHRPAESHKLTAQQRPEQWTSGTFSPLGRSLYRWNRLNCAQNTYRKHALWARYSNDGGETQDRPQHNVFRVVTARRITRPAMDQQYERTNGPAAASPPPFNIPRGMIRWSERVSQGHGRRTSAEHADEGARRNSTAEMGLVVKIISDPFCINVCFPFDIYVPKGQCEGVQAVGGRYLSWEAHRQHIL